MNYPEAKYDRLTFPDIDSLPEIYVRTLAENINGNFGI